MQGAEGLSATDGCVGGLVVQSRRRVPLGWASGGFARAGVRPKASQSAKDFLIELPERDASRVMKKPLARRREPFLLGTKAFPLRALGRWRGGATCARLIRENGEIRFSSHRWRILWDSMWTLDGGSQVGLWRLDTLAGWSEGA